MCSVSWIGARPLFPSSFVRPIHSTLSGHGSDRLRIWNISLYFDSHGNSFHAESQPRDEVPKMQYCKRVCVSSCARGSPTRVKFARVVKVSHGQTGLPMVRSVYYNVAATLQPPAMLRPAGEDMIEHEFEPEGCAKPWPQPRGACKTLWTFSAPMFLFIKPTALNVCLLTHLNPMASPS